MYSRVRDIYRKPRDWDLSSLRLLLHSIERPEAGQYVRVLAVLQDCRKLETEDDKNGRHAQWRKILAAASQSEFDAIAGVFSRYPSVEDLRPTFDDDEYKAGDFEMAVSALLVLHCPSVRLLSYPAPDSTWYAAMMTHIARLSGTATAPSSRLHTIFLDHFEYPFRSRGCKFTQLLQTLQWPGLERVRCWNSVHPELGNAHDWLPDAVCPRFNRHLSADFLEETQNAYLRERQDYSSKAKARSTNASASRISLSLGPSCVEHNYDIRPFARCLDLVQSLSYTHLYLQQDHGDSDLSTVLPAILRASRNLEEVALLSADLLDQPYGYRSWCDPVRYDNEHIRILTMSKHLKVLEIHVPWLFRSQSSAGHNSL